MPSLFVIQGRDQGKRFELDGAVMSVGRDHSNLVQLHDTEISRRHAEIRRAEGGYRWVDLGSSNGSYINNQRVDDCELRSGDRIQIGRTLMTYLGTPYQSGSISNDVDIVTSPTGRDDSQIIKSIRSEEGSQLLAGADVASSSWLARARSNLQVMYRTALAVSHTLDIEQLLHRIMDLIFEWVEADRGCVMLVDRETDELVPKVRRDRLKKQNPEKMTISRTIIDYVCSHQEGVLTSNARDDERWETAASIVKWGIREAICVPMQGRYGMVGVIYIDTFTPPGRMLPQRSPDKFSDEHLKLMVAIGHQAALAIEDTSYYSAMLQAERLAAIGQTIASLSHHIKNILQGIRGGSYLIEEGLKANDPEITRKGWRIVEKNQERISCLVLDMLTFSKERQPEMVPHDLNQVVGDVLELMETRAVEEQVRLVDARSEQIPLMTFDGEALHRAVLNVVTNALDAVQQQPEAEVVVSTAYLPDECLLQVTVRDNGPGIAEADQRRIFSIFESKKGSRGTGLGLAVSQKILQEHSGDIRLESEVGQGSCFVLEFPAVAPDSATAPLASSGDGQDRQD